MLLVLSFYDTGNCDFLHHKKNICLTNACSRCIISVNSGEKFMISKAFQSKEACLMSITWDMDIEEKLKILADAAKYDVSCVSSGVDRKNDKTGMGNSVASGICHSFAGDGRCISLLKILMTNDCCYDCKYCINRVSNDVPRASFTPEEICTLTMAFYRRNYIEGLFLSSGVLKNPDYTMERMYTVLWLLRNKYHFQGYIHVKIIPGADETLVENIGFLADRVSCNLELPTSEGLKTLAPAKKRENIIKPMRQIQKGIDCRMRTEKLPLPPGVDKDVLLQENTVKPYRFSPSDVILPGDTPDAAAVVQGSDVSRLKHKKRKHVFVPGGQSTQMIIGATPETDFHILSVTEALYQKFQMRRVFYSAYVPLNEDRMLPALDTKPPLLREHRLYQADWLLRFYGFRAGELLSEQKQNFNILLDPKCDWAIGHLECFPVEVNTADYYTLLRVPGIGVTGAQRICRARKTVKLDFNDLKKMGIVLKRAVYFITCSGKQMYPVKLDEDYITRNILDTKEKLPPHLREAGESYRQLSLFDDFGVLNTQMTSIGG